VLLAATGSTPNVYLYAGEQLDPNVGFYYLRARYYNPAQGRFITTDPEEGNIFDSVSLHRYLYANANPIQFTDPSGRVSLVEGAVVAAVLVPIAAVGVWVSETLKRNARKGQALPNPNEYRAERKALEYDYGAETEFMDIFTAYQTWAKIEPNKSIKGLCDYLKVSQNVVNKFSLVVLEHRAARTQHLIALWTAIGAPEPITVRLSLDWTDEREQYKTTPTIWEKKLSEYTNVTPQVCPP
jgi:RHS repeat-associated protein